jgi:hypothetical protein
VQVANGMLDAVLFSADRAFSPETGKLPPPVKDEPHEPPQIETCRKEAQRRMAAGLHTMCAISNAKAQESLRDLVDRPILSIDTFFGTDNAVVAYARAKGFRPISYWMANTTWPLYYRALVGLYNRRCAYQGCAPWAYQDFADNRLYDTEKVFQRVAYPDESGQPIPTLCWEAYRAGIDDVRYLEALDRAIAACQKRAAEADAPDHFADAVLRGREVRRRCYETVGGRYIEYLCNLPPRALAQARREMADATVVLEQALRQGE